MKISLIESKSVSALFLPEKINGQYWMSHLDPFGKKEKILSIEGVNGSWVLKTGRNTVLQNDMNMTEQVESDLSNGQFLTILFKKTGERAHIIATDMIPSYIIFKKYIVQDKSKFLLGSATSSDLVIDSPYISANHLELEYKDETFTLKNLCPRFGVYVNNVKTEEGQLKPGDVIYIMGVEIVVAKDFIAINNIPCIRNFNPNILHEYQMERIVESVDEEFFDDIEIENEFFRSPRFKRDIIRNTLNLDSPPTEQKGSETPAILTMGPALTMGSASMMTTMYTVNNTLNGGGDISSLMPTIVMAGSMLAGSVLWPVLANNHAKKATKKKERIRKKKYYNYLEKIRNNLKEEGVLQKEILNENYVPLDECIHRVEHRDRRLWERMPTHNDFLSLRIGKGNLPLDIEFSSNKETFEIEDDELKEAMYLLANADRLVEDVPVPVSMTEDHIIGITGSRHESIKFVQNLVIQLVSLHSYTDLKMIFLYDEKEKEQWDFVRWLPHVWDDAKKVRFIASSKDSLKELTIYFERMITSLQEAGSDTLPNQRYIIFSTDREMARRAEMLNLVINQPNYFGFSALLLYDELPHLPKECKMVIELNGGESRFFNRDDISGQSQFFLPDLSRYSPNKVAVSLSNIKLSQSEKAFTLPSMLTFLEMFNVEKIEHLNPLERWKENNPVHTLQAPIGISETGDVFYLDLHEKYHGPHGLIAGMTGSGKSEFIMTYILSLALNYHPNEVAFILIDYKGGGMANAFSNLPHLAGTITNLDGAAVNRSLVSIESELKRRQAIFSATSEQVGVSNIDIYKYQKLFREGTVTEPLQHLFMISDEFAELKTQQPEFMDQLVSAARIGRSLGVHLILATQKPSGVVDDQIWSNSRFRVCLKVQDDGDSQDMIKRPDAAALTDTGRYYVQVGFNELFEMGQSAWAGAPYIPGADKVEVKDENIIFIDELGRVLTEVRPQKEVRHVENPPKQLDEITAYLNRLAKEEGISIKQLWLEPIPAIIFIGDVEKKYTYEAKPFQLNPVIGIYDNPKEQSQDIKTIPLGTGGNMVVYGSTGNGKTTFITSLVYSTTLHHTAEEVSFYLLDFGSETLKAFQRAPQVGDVITANEEEKISNMFRMIEKEIAERKKLFVDYGGDYESYAKNHADKARMIIVIHNYAAFSEMYEDIADDQLSTLSREGSKLGVIFILTCVGVSDIRYKLLQNFSQIYSMQLNDPSDYAMVFPTNEKPNIEQYKGRALFYDGGLYEFQTAYPTDPDEVFSFIQEYSLEMNATYEGKPALTVPILPELCNVDFLEQHIIPNSEKLPVGVNTSTLEICQVLFDKYMNLVEASLAEPCFFLQGMADILYTKQSNITSIDIEGEFIKSDRCPVAKGIIEAKVAAQKLVDVVLERHKTYRDHSEQGASLPVFEHQYFIINKLDQLISELDGELLSDFTDALVHGRDVFNVHLIFSVDNLAGITHEEWFTKHDCTDTFIWVGAGISEQFALRVTGNTAELRQELPEDFGFIVNKSKYQLAKLVVPNGLSYE